jgi:hypothetical protein
MALLSLRLPPAAHAQGLSSAFQDEALTESQPEGGEVFEGPASHVVSLFPPLQSCPFPGLAIPPCLTTHGPHPGSV